MNELLCVDGILFVTTLLAIVMTLRGRPIGVESARTVGRAYWILMGYSVVVATSFIASLFLEGGYTIGGAILYGTIIGGFHALAMGGVFSLVSVYARSTPPPRPTVAPSPSTPLPTGARCRSGYRSSPRSKRPPSFHAPTDPHAHRCHRPPGGRCRLPRRHVPGTARRSVGW